jgi:hypothetical protein
MSGAGVLFNSPPVKSRWGRHASAAVCVLSLVAFSVACSNANVGENVRVTDLSGGWYDAGIVDGKNRLLPSVSFRLEKTTNAQVGPLALNILFKRLVNGTEQEWEDVYLQRVEFSDGNRTQLLTVRAPNGYTGDPPQSRLEMLENSAFVDARAIIFARQGSTWIELGRYDLPRTLITQ